MNSSKYITMWSVQGDRVLNTLEKDGIYYVKKKYLDQKYQDTAWIFKTAYDFFNKHAAERMPKPPEAESPVWMFQDSKWAVASEGTKILRLQVPEEKIILFDLRKWSRILNLSYIGSEEECIRFEKRMLQQGITAPSDMFEKPYYPSVKKEVIKSWEKLFETEGLEKTYTQGAAWMIEREWIEDIIVC